MAAHLVDLRLKSESNTSVFCDLHCKVENCVKTVHIIKYMYHHLSRENISI